MIDRKYHILNHESMPKTEYAGGFDDATWDEVEPNTWWSYRLLSAEDRQQVCEYLEAWRSKRDHMREDWGEWASTSSGLTISADESDAMILSGYEGSRLVYSDYRQIGEVTLHLLQNIGAHANRIQRSKQASEFMESGSDRNSILGFTCVGSHGDLALIKYDVDQLLVDPLGNSHDFVPVDAIGLRFAHTSNSQITSALLGFAHRLGLTDEQQEALFLSPAVEIFDGLQQSRFHDYQITRLLDVAVSNQTIRQIEGLLDWPIPISPGSNQATGIRKVDDILEFYLCLSSDPNDQLSDKTIKIGLEDLPVLIRLVYANSRGESISQISDLLDARFGITKSLNLDA